MTRGIKHQNKDIIFKILSENYKNKSLNVYGLNLPPIKEVLPTNLPVIELNEKRSDNLFLLEDDTILLLEYESSANPKNFIKYGHYGFRVTESYYDKLCKIKIVVIYTADVETAPNSLDLGDIKIHAEQVFLAKFKSDEIYNDLKRKVEAKQELSEEDIMRFIILPLTQKNNKQSLIGTTVDLAKEVINENKQSFIIAGVLSATDKFIDRDYANKLREWLAMTKVGQIFEEEKLEYAQQSVQKEKKEIAKKMFLNDIDLLKVMEITMLPKADLLKIKEEIISNKN